MLLLICKHLLLLQLLRLVLWCAELIINTPLPPQNPPVGYEGARIHQKCLLDGYLSDVGNGALHPTISVTFSNQQSDIDTHFTKWLAWCGDEKLSRVCLAPLYNHYSPHLRVWPFGTAINMFAVDVVGKHVYYCVLLDAYGEWRGQIWITFTSRGSSL